MVKQLVRSNLILLAIASLVCAADIEGKWKGSFDTGEGDTVFTLKLDGSSVTGTMAGADGKEYPLKGKLDGEKISFTVESEWQGTPVKLVVSGAVTGDSMKLNIGTADGAWSSTITAKRL